MSADYAQRLDDLEDLLREVAPERIVTRTWKEFGQRVSEDLQKGIFTILSAGIGEYPSLYEPGDDGRQTVLIVYQGKVAEGSDGPTLEANEFEAIGELEAVAEQAPHIWPSLTLQSAETSKQMENPYCWVRSQWQTFTDRKES